TQTIAAGTTVTVAGTLTFDAAGSSGVSFLNGGTLAAQGNIVVADGINYGGTTLLQLTGTANQTWTDAGGTKPGSAITINKASGTVTLGSNVSVNVAGQDLAITSGTLDLAGYNLTVNDLFTIGAAGNLQLQGAETLSKNPTTITAGGTVKYNGTAASYTLKNFTNYSNLVIN